MQARHTMEQKTVEQIEAPAVPCYEENMVEDNQHRPESMAADVTHAQWVHGDGARLEPLPEVIVAPAGVGEFDAWTQFVEENSLLNEEANEQIVDGAAWQMSAEPPHNQHHQQLIAPAVREDDDPFAGITLEELF